MEVVLMLFALVFVVLLFFTGFGGMFINYEETKERKKRRVENGNK